MNIALTHIHAAASARFCGKSAFVRALVLGCALACAGAPAFAGQERDRDHDGPRNQQGRDQAPPRAERPAPPPAQQQRVDPRQYEQRGGDDRHQAQQQQQPQQQEQGPRRGGRLTPDERRELRRQINEAGIDLYPNTPRR